LESMHVMFGSAHVTRASASTPGNLLDNPSDDEVHEVEKIPRMPGFLVYQKRVRSVRPLPLMGWKIRKREAHFYDCIRILVTRYKGVEKLTLSVEASSASLTSTQIPIIAEAMRMVKKCGVKEKTSLIHTATLVIVKP
jgi:hypothetical protein